MFCSAAKATKISAAVEDLNLIAVRIETLKKTHKMAKMIHLCPWAILEINVLIKLQPVPFRPGMKYGDIKIYFMFSIHWNNSGERRVFVKVSVNGKKKLV